MKPKTPTNPIERIWRAKDKAKKKKKPYVVKRTPAKSYDIPAVVTAENVLAWAKTQPPQRRIYQPNIERDLVVVYMRETYGIEKGWMAFEHGCIEEPYLKTFKVDAPLTRVLRGWAQKHPQGHTRYSRMSVFTHALERELAVEEQHKRELAHLASLRSVRMSMPFHSPC